MGLNYQKAKELVNTRRAESPSGDSSFKSSLAKYQAKAPTSSLAKYRDPSKQYTENGAEIIGEYEPLTNAPKRTLWDDIKGAYKHIGQTGNGFLTIAMSLADRVATRVEQAAYVIGEDMKDGNPFNAISDEERAERRKTLDAMEYRTQDVTSSLGKFRSTIQNKQDKDRQDMSQMGQGAQLVVGAIESLPSTVVSRIPYAGMAINGVASYDQAMDSLYNDMQATGVEIPADKARLYSLGVAAVEAGSEMMFPAGSATAKGVSTLLTKAPAKGLLGRAAQRLATYLAKDSAGDIIIPTVGRQLKSLAIEAAQEGAEEVVSSIGQGLLAEALIHPEKKLFGWDDANINAKDALLSFAGGALAGGMFSGVMGLTYYPKARAFVESKTGLKIRQMTEQDIEGFLKAAREDFKSPDAQAELTDQLTRNLALSTSTGQFVTDPKTGAVYRVSAPDPETGAVMLFGSDGAEDLVVTPEQLAQNFTAPASAVTDSSLPVTDGPSPAAGVAPQIIERQTLSGEAVPMFTETLPDGGTVTAEATGKSVLLTVAPQTGAPYSFEVDAEEYSRALATGSPLPALLAASGRNKEQGNLGRYIARNGLSKSAQGVWTAVDRATRSAFDDHAVRVKAEAEAKETAKQTEEVKQAEKELEEAKTAGEKTQVKTKTKALRDKARKVQETAVKKGQMAERHLKALLKMDQQNEAQGFDTYYNVLPEGKQSALQKKLAQIVAAANGKEVIWIYNAAGEDAIDGFVAGETDSTVYINADVKTNALQTIGHELFHQARKAGLTKAFEQAVLASTKMTKDQLIQAYADKYASQADYFDYLQANPEIALEEALADKAGEVFATPEFLQKFAERAGQAKFDAFIQKVKDWLQKIRDVAPEEVDTLLEALTAKVEAKNDLGINAETQQIMDEHGYDPGKFAVRPTIEAAKEGSIKIEMELIKDKIKAENPGLSAAKLKKLIRAEAEKRTEQVRQVVEMTGSIFEAITSRYPEYLSRMLEETGHTHFGPIRENAGGYVYTFDLDTLCTRAIKFRAQTDALINKLGRFPDEHELTAMLFWMRESGDLIPCVYCYVESKRRLKMDAFNVWSNTKFNIASGITPNMTLAQAKKAFGATMYGTDEKGKMTDAGETVFKRWFEEAKSGSLRPMAGTELFRGYQTVRKDIFARFDKEFNPKAKSRNTELERVTALIADELGVEDRKGKTAFAWRSLNTLATEWNYYAQSPGEKPVVYTSLETVSDPVAYLHNMAEATDYSNSVSSAKGVELFEHYTDQLTSVSVINKIAMNAHGGFRIHSSNDFRVDHAMDYVLFVTHLAQDRRGGEGWKSHMYTKSVECARFLANTHIKINCSIAFNTQPNGEITVNDKEGMPLKDIIQLRELSPDIGSMAMVTDDAQLEYCLNAPWVDQIIPFHMSGMKKAIWDSVLGWSDYTRVQSDDWPNAEYRAEHPDLDEKIKHKLFTREKVADPETGVKIEKLVPYKPAFLPFDKIIPKLFYQDGTSAINTLESDPVQGWKIPGWARATEAEGVKAYFELCQDYGVMPRFWMHRLSDGTRLTDHPNYVKLIKETSRMDTPHRDVEANFDHKQIYDMTEDFAKRGGYENIERPNLTELDYFMRTFFDEVDGEYVFRKDMSPLKANIMSLIKVGGIDLSRLTPSQIRDNKDLIKEYFTETASGFEPTEETAELITSMLSRAPRSLLKAYGLPDISMVEKLADKLEQDVFFNYLDPATVEGKLALQNTLNAQQENPGSLTWLKHLPLTQQAETPERMARAVEILESWSKESSLYTTRAQQLSGITKALGLVHLEDEVRGVLRGKGLLYSVRQGKLPAKATKSSLVDTVFDAFKGAKKPEPVDFIGMDAYDLRQVAAMAMLVRDPRVEHRHIYAIKHGVVVHHESWTSNLPAAAYALPENPEVYKRLMDRLQLIQPTRIVFSHNHPSGDPTPSQPDKDATQKMVQLFPGKVYDGEIITDHNTYSYIAPNGDVRTGVFRQNQDREALPAKYNWAKKRGKDVNYDGLHAWVSAQKILPDLALREGDPTLIYLDSKLRVTGVQHVSNQLLRDRSAFTKHVTDSKPNFSAMHVLAYAADENSADLLRGYWNGNVLRDVIDASRVREDQYLYQEGHRAPSPDFGAPAHDLVTTGMYPSDVYSPQGLRYYGTGDTREDAKVWNMLKAMRGNPEAKVTVYRAVPGHVDTINPGDWVAITKDYAQKHADHVLSGMSPRILTKTVTAKELYTNGDSWSEWGYHPAGTQLGESLDRFGGEVGGIPAFTSPFSQWLFAMHEKDPNKKRSAQEWDALIIKAPFKSSYEYEFLGIKDWLLQQKSLTAGELFDYYQDHAGMMDEQVYENPRQWSEYSPSREFSYDPGQVQWTNYRARVITIDPQAIPTPFSNEDSRLHFPAVKRVMMHTRMEDVTTPTFPNGATYLIEAQSDLHSEGQKNGYDNLDIVKNAVHNTGYTKDFNPEAPFGKDYMLLGFKTALRDAVNAGHDAVLWAGWMHARRWRVEGNLIYAKVLEKRDTGITLEYQTAGMSSPEIKSFVLDLGSANGLNMEPEFGVENAAKLRASKTGDTVFGQSRTALLGMGVQRHPDTDEIIEDAGPTFGKMYNNMVPRMYDEELVSQVKKYAKQWGVEPKYEQVEGLPGYQWVFPITDKVRDAVRSGPQVAYSVRAQRSFSRAYAEEFLSKGTLARITEAHLFYDIQPNRVTMAAAAAILNSGRAKAEALARNVNAFRDAASTALRIYFMLEADLQGNHEAAAEWALIAAQAGTTLGQAVQAYAMLRKLSAGSLQLLTARKLNQLLSEDDREQIDRVSAGIFSQLNAIDQNKVDEMLAKTRLEDLKRLIETEEGRAEALQQRLAKLESDLLYYENDPVRQYVEALHDIAAATVPYQDMYQGSDLRGFIKWAIDHPGLTSRMWELAHDTLHNLHYADSSFMEQIEGYFGDYLPKRRRNGLKLTRRSYEEIIAAIKEHFAAEDHTANALIARLKELGVDPADATLIAHSMTEQLAKLTKRQKLNSLTRLLPVMRRGGRSTRDKLERMVNLANEIGVNEATVKANIANLMGLPGLTPELQAELSQIAKDIGAIQANARKQARAMNEEESRMVDFKMAILLARIQQQKPARVGDKIENFRYMMMLSWIKPAERNIIGNALFLFTDTIKDTAAATLDIAASKALGINRAIPYPDLKKAFQGMLKGARYGAEDIKAGVNTSELDTQYSINQGQMYRSKTMQTLTAIYRFKMALPDRIAQTAAYESHLAGLKRLNDGRKPEERMSAEDLHEQALLFAAKKTFTDDNIISQTFSELRASLNLLSTLGHTTRWGLGSVLLPFTKVPGALLMRTLEYSPLSVGRAMAYLVKHTYAVGWRGEGKAEWHKKYQKKFSTALADAGWGTLTTLVLGAFLRSIGVITGEPPEDSQEYNLRKVMGVGRGYLLNWSALRRCFANGFDAEAAAWQDEDFLSTYSWLAPMSLGMSIGANWWDLRQTLTGKDGTYYGSWASELLLAVASGTQSIMDLSMMQGVAQLMDTGYASNFRFTPEGETQRPFYLENFLNVAVSYPSSFVPNELKMLREAIDNTQRNVYDQNYLRYAYWLVLNKLPGASKLLAPKYDVLGNELKVYQTSGWKRYLDLAVNPALTNKLILDENAMLVMDVYLNKTVDDSVRLPTAKRYLVKSEMVNGQKIETKVPLTAKEQAELQRVIGTRIDEAISRVPRNISVDAQAAQIHDIISKESKRTIAELLAWKEMQSGG